MRERRRLVRAFRAKGRTSLDVSLRSYLGSPVPVLGVRTPEFDRIMRGFSRGLAGRSPEEMRKLVRALWQGTYFEEKVAAIELLEHSSLLEDEGAWHLASRWVDEATGWALSDSLASGPVATMVAVRPGRFRELRRWTAAGNLWRRRAATYALRAWVRAGELDRPFVILERLLDDPERWVQRAVGTWLRECWKEDRVRTERFLRRAVRRLAPVTITVATERAPKRFREELRRASRDIRATRRGL